MSKINLKDIKNLINTVGPDNITPTSLALLLKDLSNDDGEETGSKKAGIVTRALESDEYDKIIELLKTGFIYENKNGKMSRFKPQPNVALALSLEATLGLKISDILQLKVKDFHEDTLEILEIKTNKLQYKKIDPQISEYIRNYALENRLSLNDHIINVGIRWIQNRLQKVSRHLGLLNIGTHSFRKFFATYVYIKSNGDIDLVRRLLNHSSISVTQEYLNTSQKKIDEISQAINFLIRDNNDTNK
ncbi:tyrosine-type recombinase/integrase (plasmid) [Clostridium beijerinckii]|uniref:tyrosine-type recombinase/integrase n=1 Tax=Clostridium beijerinckii TaxID=1520 RepID=UPI002225E926|nr:tyrosine-type recombinase/integrase [Clostridium beijerinckii]UYZ39049.1 tyrosine-type recombinase/integrase [Clostridium beijerinckii]